MTPIIRHRSSASKESGEWDLYAALCLQRTPVIGPELNWIERRLKEYLNKVEIADSLYSDHEMRHFEDLRRAERIASGVNVAEKDLEEAAKQTAQDFEESSLSEANKFVKGSRVTKADLTNNTRSIDRSLDKHLYFVQKRNVGSSDVWMLPQEHFNSSTDHSLRQAAERAFDAIFPSHSKDQIKFLGNVPFGYYWYRYPKPVAKDLGTLGARLFFFKANLYTDSSIKGPFGERVLSPADEKEFTWSTRAELSKQLPPRYWRTLERIIYPDELVDLEALMQQKKRKISRLSNRLQKLESKIDANASI
ncbi:PREDICTED: 39S ribosomal protein L46, mitochondrial [Rhagoletis zephyria]|uniref:39S ribosomal protein L46, mitochondrial n=1 Tax=Rhagoletis zephyria TaxID=28612 RepID=UPI0008116BE0|nr:PREDICTED: 39S ribosomal protein L46, mitochondrial [Rhagoletis zephyria]